MQERIKTEQQGKKSKDALITQKSLTKFNQLVDLLQQNWACGSRPSLNATYRRPLRNFEITLTYRFIKIRNALRCRLDSSFNEHFRDNGSSVRYLLFYSFQIFHFQTKFLWLDFGNIQLSMRCDEAKKQTFGAKGLGK